MFSLTRFLYRCINNPALLLPLYLSLSLRLAASNICVCILGQGGRARLSSENRPEGVSVCASRFKDEGSIIFVTCSIQ